MSSNNTFEIDFLDHVAIRVKDLKVSEAWYEKVLGLKKYQLDEWGPFPVFMLAKKSGVAL
ncbi:MAG: VOC family protein, partial [Eudoraea sp.]